MKRIYRRTVALISAGILFFSSFAQFCDTVDTVNAQDYEAGSDNVIEWDAYGQTIYNTTNGLISNHVSSIEQTSDGVVWIGTDEGLSAYDGNEFTTYGSFYHFDGINDMVRTADGGIWYATTTYGGAIYLGSRFQHFDDVSEQVSNYATAIAEGADGTIYVGTLRGMLLIHPASGYTVTELVGEDYFYVNSIASGRQRTGALTVNGDVLFFDGDNQVERHREVFSGQACIYYADGYYLVGTSDGRILVLDEERLEEGVIEEMSVPLNVSAGSGKAINDFFYEENSRLWVLSDGGIGYYALTDGGISTIDNSIFVQCSFDNFESGFTDMMMDYQGNYWISSSKRGVLLLCKSDFKDELSQLGLDIDRINAVYEKDGILYGATDSGLITLDRRDRAVVNIEWTDVLRGMKLTDVTAYDDKLYVAV
ncbi:MAG: two-component regulator propeller domain-containing protein, partial [Lachnospiraceae bacterium]